MLKDVIQSFVQPKPLPYDPLEWEQKPWAEQLKLACRAWAVDGYGTPNAVYLFYVLKVVAYIGLWAFFCSFTPGLGNIATFETWWLAPEAFKKAVLWSMAFEGLGLGCASGPLTGRYRPVVGGFLHFLRPGTTKLPLFPGLPLLGSSRRNALEVLLYIAYYVALFNALISPTITNTELLPIVILLPILGLSDKTIVLCARAEHYYVTTLCFLFGNDWIAGAMAVQTAIWLWAATSKLNHHFPSVVSVMNSNSPVMQSTRIRKAMYRDYPNDLRPSRAAYTLAHLGTVIEFVFPVLLVVGTGGHITTVGIVLMLVMHTYITSNVPMAVPIEWNVHVVYGGLFLFLGHSHISPWSIESPILATVLVVMLVLVPLVGNFWPHAVSFLFSMRYYAGNWAYNVWLFKRDNDSHKKLDQHLTKAAVWIPDQLADFYDETTIIGILGKVPAFRAMHLHGRALHTLLPKAVDDMKNYEYVDGEMVAGMVLGWNFGDGHLHSEQLLESVQAQCQFEPGDVRCIFIESQPLFGSGHQWRIVDAATGQIDQGHIPIAQLRKEQPWPTQGPLTT